LELFRKLNFELSIVFTKEKIIKKLEVRKESFIQY